MTQSRTTSGTRVRRTFVGVGLAVGLLLGISGAARADSQTRYAGDFGTNNFTAMTQGGSGPGGAVGSDTSTCSYRYSSGGHNGFWNTYGFSIPAGATIDGIQVEYLRSWAQDPPSAGSAGVNVGKNEATLATEKIDTPVPSGSGCNSGSVKSLGGASDLWGLAWTPGEINADSFSVRFRAANGTEWGWRITWIRVTVFYTPSGPTGLSVAKSVTTLEDPFNATTNPKAIPGATVGYSIDVSNPDATTVDANTVIITEAVPANTDLFVGDVGGAGSGPVAFVDGVPASGLTYTFTSLASATDDVSFSNNGGATYSYTPVPDVNGVDSAVTHVRINPKGTFNASTSFQIQFRVRVE